MRSYMSGKPFYAVIDFEATCWEEESRADQEMIEWGCVKVDARSGKALDEFGLLVRPTRIPMLSDYCVALTGITQQDVDRAVTFPYALAMATEWMGDPLDYTFCSWGEFDRYLLRAMCRFYRVPYPFDDDYLDLKPIFSDRIAGRNVDMRKALAMLEIPHAGRLHRALDDARNVAIILDELLRSPYRHDL